MIEYYDQVILFFINGFALKYWSFDKMVEILEGNMFIKGGVIISIYWFFWFPMNTEVDVVEQRKTILASIIGTLCGLFIAMILAIVLPFRIRPLHDPELSLLIPAGVKYFGDGWSSFPSDNATLFSGLAMGIFLISRKIGAFVMLYVLFIILIPRVYLGFHYPTDIFGGILIGIVVVLIANIHVVKNILTNKLLGWSEKYPPIFYGLLFLFTFELANLFDNLREIGKYGWTILNKIVFRII